MASTMDLMSEESSASRVLTARHISADKSPPETDEAINTTFPCHTYNLHPDIHTYYSALQPYGWVIWTCGLLVLVAIWLLYILTLRSALRHWRHHKINVAVVLCVYPLVAGAAFITVVVPRARVLAEALAQEAVMITLYHFFCLVIAECGGPEQLVTRAAGSHMETRVPPCCCWPCCVIPKPKLDRKYLEWLRRLVLQLPVTQGLLYTLILVIWAEDFMMYHDKFLYFQPLIAASILSGIWGVNMCVRTVTTLGYNPKPRFLAVQLVLIIVKLQCGIVKVLADELYLPCIVPLHPSVFANMIQNSVMMLEMLLLSLWAWRLYRIPPGKDLEKVEKVVVATLEDACDMKIRKEGIDNRSFNNNVVDN